MKRDIFQAIADPTRRAILTLIAFQALTPNAMAEKFDMSRQAVSLHIKILHECGLIAIQTQGRERYCKARLEQLTEVAEWIAQYRKHFEMKLDSLDTYLDKLQKQKKYGKPKK